MKLVAVDIGGTHARFALAEIDQERIVSLGAAVTLQTAEHASFEDAWEVFAKRIGAPLPAAIALAIAGQVEGEAIRFTNNDWVIPTNLITKRLGIQGVTIINDFGAVGHAVAHADAQQFEHLCGPDQPLPGAGTISVVGPGTGLGVAHVWRDEGVYHVQATEGGHTGFAPLDAVEDAILAHLRTHHARVSVERVVSGPGLVDIYETLAGIEGRTVEQLDDKTLWLRGASGEDRLATAAINRFCLSLGSVAGDIALAHGASGVVIAGGLGLRMKEMLKHSGFAERFRAKGRFEKVMAGIPVKLITHPQPGLFGAAAAFAQEHFL